MIIYAAILSSCTQSYSGKIPPKADKGILDLRDWDFKKDGSVKLEGSWEFYWDQLYSLSELNSEIVPKTFGLITVPSIWTSKKIGRSHLPVKGFTTYRLKILLPESNDTRLSIRIPSIDTTYRLAIEDKLIFENGSVGTEVSASKPVYYAPVNREIQHAPELNIIVTMSNFHYPRPGMRDCLVISDSESSAKESEHLLVLDMFLIGAIFLMAMYHAGLYYLRRSDRSALYFALLCLCTLCRLMVTGEGYAYRYTWFSWSVGTAVEYITFYGCGVTCALYIFSLYPKEVSEKIIKLMLIVSLFFTSLVILTPVMFYAKTLFLFNIFVGLMIIYFIYLLSIAVIRKRESAKIFTVGALFLFTTIINDLLFNYRLVHTAYIMPYGLYSFFFVQSFLLSSKFSRAFNAVEDLSRELEDKVKDRTYELELERNKLEHSNTLMEKEILLARKIQEYLIPQKSPAPYINCIYRPMMQVGGDFYDFIRFRDPHKTGIFLSDVSGHGVPAAFITSMIKSILLQAGDKKDNPAEMMTYINEVLYNQTGGYFCTAFYLIFDKSDRSITYANAGHDRPLIISDDGINFLEGKRSVPVGMFSNEELEEGEKKCVTEKEILPVNSKLLIYTDGLTETRAEIGSNQFFEETELRKSITELRNHPGREFTAELYQRLVNFRGSENFEDDICIICLDVD